MIRTIKPLWVWAAIAGVSLLFTVGISVTFTVFWVHKTVSNECGALSLIINDAHLQNQPFRQALVQWRDGDACPAG